MQCAISCLKRTYFFIRIFCTCVYPLLTFVIFQLKQAEWRVAAISTRGKLWFMLIFWYGFICFCPINSVWLWRCLLFTEAFAWHSHFTTSRCLRSTMRQGRTSNWHGVYVETTEAMARCSLCAVEDMAAGHKKLWCWSGNSWNRPGSSTEA